MWFSNYKLIEKKKLTQDVYEMVFSDWNETTNKPGQFMTFMLPKTKFGRRDIKINLFLLIVSVPKTKTIPCLKFV